MLYQPVLILKKDKDGSTSVLPLKKLDEEKGYTLLCSVRNLIFIKNGLLNTIS